MDILSSNYGGRHSLSARTQQSHAGLNLIYMQMLDAEDATLPKSKKHNLSQIQALPYVYTKYSLIRIYTDPLQFHVGCFSPGHLSTPFLPP
jgi:hypothetical protein